MTDMETRVARLNTMIEEGRIIRHEWTDGHERACLLAGPPMRGSRARSGRTARGDCRGSFWQCSAFPWIGSTSWKRRRRGRFGGSRARDRVVAIGSSGSVDQRVPVRASEGL